MLDDDRPKVDMAVGLLAMNCLNCSTIWGSKADGGVKSEAVSTDGVVATYGGGLNGGKEGRD